MAGEYRKKNYKLSLDILISVDYYWEIYVFWRFIFARESALGWKSEMEIPYPVYYNVHRPVLISGGPKRVRPAFDSFAAGHSGISVNSVNFKSESPEERLFPSTLRYTGNNLPFKLYY